MRNTLLVMAVIVGLLFLGTAPAMAHHAFSSEFDGNRPVELTGTVTRMAWVNPHAWIYMDVAQPDGTVEQWMVEGGTPNTLIRRGLRRSNLPAGTEIKVNGFRSKDGTMRANGTNITLANGRQLFIGSPGTGAPLEGRENIETPGN